MAINVHCTCGADLACDNLETIVTLRCPVCKREVTLESMRGRLKVIGDIVEPLDEPWEANE